MRTYTITQIASLWHVHTYDAEQDHLTAVETHFADEDTATRFALLHAERNRPSEVVRITRMGEKSTVATFEPPGDSPSHSEGWIFRVQKSEDTRHLKLQRS